MRFGFIVCGMLAVTVSSVTTSIASQMPDGNEQALPLRLDSTFVWIPALVTTSGGQIPDNIDITRLRLLDNGSSQTLSEINTSGLPVSLVLLMQTGGSASRFLSDYSDLPQLMDRLLGSSVHEITLVTFDSRLRQIWHFPKRTDGVDYALTNQRPGDKGAAIKDAISFGVRQLQNEPGQFRRIVLLISQGQDEGSTTSSQSLLEQLGTSSTVLYSLTFSGKEAHLSQPQRKRHSGSAGEALKRVNQALDEQTSKEVAFLTGGSHFRFEDQRSFNSAMLQTISNFHSGITLGFQPSIQEFGLHSIKVLADSPKLCVTARAAYWRPGPE